MSVGKSVNLCQYPEYTHIAYCLYRVVCQYAYRLKYSFQNVVQKTLTLKHIVQNMLHIILQPIDFYDIVPISHLTDLHRCTFEKN